MSAPRSHRFPLRILPDRCLLRKSRPEDTSRSRRGFEGHAIPLTLQELNGALADTLRMATLIVVGPWLLVGGVARQQVVRGHEHRMRHGDDALLVAAMSHHAPIPGREGALRRAGAAGQRGLNERAAQPSVSLADLAGSVFSRALVVARAEAGPAGELRRGR